MSYILEVQRYRHPERKGQCLFKHVGYMDKYFRTMDEACLYYDRHHPHMRSLNVNHDWTSDCNSNTKLRYIVRNWYWEFFCIVPWYRPFVSILPFTEPIIEN